MEIRKLKAKFKSFEFSSPMELGNATVAIPVSKGVQQKYFFFNLKSGKGLMVKCPRHGGLFTRDGFGFVYHFCSFVRNKNLRLFPRMRTLFQKYHNGISFFEILFKLSKPHGVTHIDDQRYLVSFWSSSNFFIIDLRKREIEVQTLYKASKPSRNVEKIFQAFAAKEIQEIFSTYQYYERINKETYFATQLRDQGKVSAYHKKGVNFDVPVKIRTYNWKSKQLKKLWEGNFGEAAHFIALSKENDYLGLVQFGDYFDKDKSLLPSKILILDLKKNKEWWIDNTGWSPSAHLDWDPVEPHVCYLSCHNGVIAPVGNPLKFYFQKVYKWDIFGPASIHKYEMTSNGPRKIGVFTHPEMFRMTIHKVFVHRRRKLVVCTGFPNYVFFADADSLEFVKKVELKEETGKTSVMGSLYPSPDGEKIYLITTKSFQIVDVESGDVEFVYNLGKIHDPFNHMISVTDTNW